MNQTGFLTSNLPAVIPDLLLQNKSGLWQVREISTRLAAACGSSPTSLIGRVLDQIFPDCSPSLAPLLDDLLRKGEDLTDVKLRLFPEAVPLLADFRLAGLAENFEGPLVRVNLRAETVASQLETGYAGLIGRSPVMREVFRKIELYADTEATVVITGETGCGKELVASALHQCGRRSKGPFAAINCSAISEDLLESELFGHEKGAFTGAVRSHRGHFEQADGGTLFLDEIGDMPLHTQSKLLRVLEDGLIQPVGSERSRKVDVRILAATNVPLEQAVTSGNFRADLYHRLAVLRIHLPSLRERSEDVPLLADHFLQQFNARYRKQIERFTPEAMSILAAYLWPGNIRELRNLIERLVIETEAVAIGGRALAEWVRERQSFRSDGQQQKSPSNALVPVVTKYPDHSVIDVKMVNDVASELNQETLQHAFIRAGGNIAAAARLLGIHRATYYRHLKRLGLGRKELSR